MRQIVLVSHGSPSDPVPLDAGLKAIAARVQALCPEHQIRAATLALPGALEAALSGFDAPEIYPFFMAEGWFTRRELPRRLARAGVTAPILLPFGTEPELPDLIAKTVTDATKSAGIEPESADLILVAHGSQVARRSKDTAQAMACRLRPLTRFWRIRTAFIEEAPFLADVAAESLSGLCLPFFAQRAGHVAEDIPAALAAAGFTGPRLPAIGEHPEAAALIARSLMR